MERNCHDFIEDAPATDPVKGEVMKVGTLVGSFKDRYLLNAGEFSRKDLQQGMKNRSNLIDLCEKELAFNPTAFRNLC